MTHEQIDQIFRKIDDVIGPPVSESPKDRHPRLSATASPQQVAEEGRSHPLPGRPTQAT
jgi:hypothetical protein